jgi:iron complex transport system permease protein
VTATLADLVVPPGTVSRSGIVRRIRSATRSRALVVSLVLAAATAVVFCVSIAVGDFPIPLRQVVPAVVGFGDPDHDFVIRTLRLPRALTAVLVGSAFGFSGAILQSLTRNQLASPDLIGITAGASVAAVGVVVLIGGGTTLVSLGALVGALATAAVIYVLSYRRTVSAYRLVLVGIGIAAALQAVTSYLLTRAKVQDAQRAMIWLTGSLNGRSWDHVRPLALAMLALVPAVLLLAPSLRILQLGDDTARGLGVPVERARAALFILAVALAAVGTAAAGPVAFVAFGAAPIARRLARTPLALVPSALTGALLLLLADLVARRLFSPSELPVGVVTGVLGAPYLLWLLARSNRVGRGA